MNSAVTFFKRFIYCDTMIIQAVNINMQIANLEIIVMISNLSFKLFLGRCKVFYLI